MPLIDPLKVAEIIKQVAQDKIVPRFQGLAEDEISTKTGPSDLVTIADLEAEIELTRYFKDILPSSQVVGEEAVSKNEASMDSLGRESDPIWVIDPVDGTYNFAHGKPVFATIVALVQGDEVIQGWIYDIPNDRFAIAEQGSGVELAGQSIKYPQMTTPLSEAKGFISRKFLPENLKTKLKPVLENEFGDIETYLCCAHEYLDILAGKAHFSLYSRIRPWDHLAGAMMLREAGGVTKKWDNSPYIASDQRGGVICAANDDIWQNIYDLLLKDHIN